MKYLPVILCSSGLPGIAAWRSAEVVLTVSKGFNRPTHDQQIVDRQWTQEIPQSSFPISPFLAQYSCGHF